jgi:hypothetical protein
MSEDKPSQVSEDEMSKEFDEIVARVDDDGAVEVPVRRDAAPREEIVGEERESTAEPVDAVESTPVEVAAVTPLAAAPEVSKPTESSRSSGGVLVLQWLTYAFWGWTALALGWLAAVTIGYFIAGNTSSVASALAYPLASVIVMLVIALVCDIVYARHEPAQKHGGANAIMLVHVVLFVLLAVAAAVTAVFALISLLLSTDPTSGTDGQMITAWTCLVVIVAFGLTAVRALFGGKRTVLRIIHWILMTVVALALIGSSLVGPVAGAQLTKDDRLIEEGLPVLQQAVSEYVEEHKALPSNLAAAEDASTSSTAASAALVSRNLVTYTPNVREATKNDSYGTLYDGYEYGTTYYYQMCVTYKQEKKADGYYATDSVSSSAGKYDSYLYISSHKKGEVCYDLKATDGYGIVYPMDDAASATDGASAQ